MYGHLAVDGLEPDLLVLQHGGGCIALYGCLIGLKAIV